MENPVFYLVRFLQLAAFEMQEEGAKRDMVGEDFPEEIPPALLFSREGAVEGFFRKSFPLLY